MRHSGMYRRLYDMQFKDVGLVTAGNGDVVQVVEGIA